MKTNIIHFFWGLMVVLSCPLVEAKDINFSADVVMKFTDGLEEQEIPLQPEIILCAQPRADIETLRKNFLKLGFYPTIELEGYLRYITDSAIQKATLKEETFYVPQILTKSFQIPDGFFIKLIFYPKLKHKIASQIRGLRSLSTNENPFETLINNTLMFHNKINIGHIFIPEEYLDEVVAQADLLLSLYDKSQEGSLTDNDMETLLFLSRESESRTADLRESLSTNCSHMQLKTRLVTVHVLLADGTPVQNASVYMRGRISYDMNSPFYQKTWFGESSPAIGATATNTGEWYFWAEKPESAYIWEPKVFPIKELQSGEDKWQKIVIKANYK